MFRFFILTSFTAVTMIVSALYVLKRLMKTSFSGAVDYCLFPIKVFLFAYRQTRHLKRNQYTFLNVNNIFPGSSPMTYEKLGNLLSSSGKNPTTYNEIHCFEWVFERSYYFWCWNVVQFYLSMPLVTYDVNNVLGLPFEAEAGDDVFGENLRLVLNASGVDDIEMDEVAPCLNFALMNASSSGGRLMAIWRVPFEKMTDLSEASVSQVFHSCVLQPITEYLGLECVPKRYLQINGSPLLPHGNNTCKSIRPDYSILDERESIICVGEMKKPCFFEPDERASVTKDHLLVGKMGKMILESQTSMIIAASIFGFLCDGYYLILVEFKDDVGHYQREYLDELSTGQMKLPQHQNLYIPFKTLILDVQSTCPSFLEGLTYFLWKAKQAKSRLSNPDSRIFSYFHLVLQLTDEPIQPHNLVGTISATTSAGMNLSSISHRTRSHFNYDALSPKDERFASPISLVSVWLSSTTPPSSASSNYVVKKFLNWRIGADFLCSYKNISVSFKIKAKYLDDVILDHVDDEDFVIMTIYDPVVQHLYEDVIDESTSRAQGFYLNEKRAIDELKSIQEYNNIYLNHKEVEIEFFEGFGNPIKGFAIISKYIENDTIPQTIETYELAKQQLELIHKAGVCHDGVELYDMSMEPGKLYLYNFSCSLSMKDYRHAARESLMKEDHRSLRSCFYEAHRKN